MNNKEIHNLYFSPNIRTIKIQEDEIGEACSAHGATRKMCTKFWSERLLGRDHSEDLGLVGRIILKWIIGK